MPNDAVADAAHADTLPPPAPESGLHVSVQEASRVVVDLAVERDNAVWLLKSALVELAVVKAGLAAAKREIHDLNAHVDALEEKDDEHIATINGLRERETSTYDVARSTERAACMQDARDVAAAYSAEGEQEAGFGALRVIEQIQKRAKSNELVEFKL